MRNLQTLTRSSRPVMPEPHVRQLETGVVHDRRVTRRELRRTGSSGAPFPRSTSPIGGSCRAKPSPWPAAGCWPAGQSSTGQSSWTIGMRRTPSAPQTTRMPGNGITRPPSSLWLPGFRTSVMGSTCG